MLVLGDATNPLNTGQVHHCLGFKHHSSVPNRKRKEYCSGNQTGDKVGIALMKAAYGDPSFDLP